MIVVPWGWSRNSKEWGDEGNEKCREQLIHDLECHLSEYMFYPEVRGEAWEDWKTQSVDVWKEDLGDKMH